MRLLPHELLFGVYLLQMWVRLVVIQGFFWRDTLIYLAILIANVLVIVICDRQPSNLRWRARLLFYPIAMNICFLLMKSAVPAIHPERVDALLRTVDDSLIGANLSLRLESFIHPAITEIMSFCYLIFFPNLFVGMIYYFIGDLALLKKFFTGLFSIYGIGFIGYSILPAFGPYIAMADDFKTPLVGWFISKWNNAVVRAGTNGVDVFPSLHCAVSSYILLFDFRHRRWRFYFYLVPAIGLWISTIYLRYHYFVDLICGFALSAFGLWLAKIDSSLKNKI